jgi:hypothetical protein
MVIRVILFFLICAAFTGCYQMGPDEGQTRTVPVTNNPNAMPGPMKTSPLPTTF